MFQNGLKPSLPSFNLNAKARKAVRHLLPLLGGYVRVALIDEDVKALGLPAVDGYIVVRSLERLKQLPGVDLQGSKLKMDVGYPVELEVVEWKVLPPLDPNPALSDLGVGDAFWVCAAIRAHKGEFLHPLITRDIAFLADFLPFPS